MKNVIKRIFIIVFAVLLFSITGCKNFMSNSDDMIDKMAEEIKNSTAPELNVFVQAISGQGNAYSSTQTVKLDIKFQITFEPDSSYGYFTGWKAYSSYNTPDQKELTEKDIKFEDASALKTDVTIYKEYKEIRILPTCEKHATINYIVPKSGADEAGTISPYGVTAQPGGEVFTVNARMKDDFSFRAWKVTDIKNNEVKISDYFDIASDSVNEFRNDAMLRLKIREGKNVNGFTFTCEVDARPKVRDTGPGANAVSVSRTSSVMLVFTKAIDPEFVKAENYKKYFEIIRRDSMVSNTVDNVIDYYEEPVLADGNMVVTFEAKNKTDEQKWITATSYITVTAKGVITDTEGIMLGNDYVFSFTFGTKGDFEGPVVSNADLQFGGKSLTKSGVAQSYWNDWEPSRGANANHVYADSFRVKGMSGEKFTPSYTASDAQTGNTGEIYYVIERLMYASKGGKLPKTTRLAESDMTFFSEDGNWLGLSGCLQSDFEKEIQLSSGNSDFEFDEGFKDAGGNYVDGIYMFELTAKDFLGNKSTSPARYFVVRDTTSPDAKENAKNVKFTADCGIDVNGKRFFGKNYKTVTFEINGKVITDAGTQGQPWTASKPENNKWAVAVGTSRTASPTTGWTSFASSESLHTVDVSSYIDGKTQNEILYVWVKFTDDCGNETEAALASAEILYIDNEKPNVPVLVDSPDVRKESSSPNDILWLNPLNPEIKFSASDTDSGGKEIFSGVNLYFKKSTESQYKKMSAENGEYKMTLSASDADGVYSIYAQDITGTQSDILKYEIKLTPPPATINILNLENYKSLDCKDLCDTSLSEYIPNNNKYSLNCLNYLHTESFDGLSLTQDPVKNSNVQYDNTVELSTKIGDVVYYHLFLFCQFEVMETDFGIKSIDFSEETAIEDYSVSQNGTDVTNYFEKDGSCLKYKGFDSRNKNDPYVFKMKIQIKGDYEIFAGPYGNKSCKKGESDFTITVSDKLTSSTESRKIYGDYDGPELNLFAEEPYMINCVSFSGDYSQYLNRPRFGLTVAVSNKYTIASQNAFDKMTSGKVTYSASDSGVGGVYYSVYITGSATDKSNTNIHMTSNKSHSGFDNYCVLSDFKDSNIYIHLDDESTKKEFSVYLKSELDTPLYYQVIVFDALGNAKAVQVQNLVDKEPPVLNNISDSGYKRKVTEDSSVWTYTRNEGASFSIEDDSGLDYALIKAYASSGYEILDVFFINSSEPFWLKDITDDESGTKYIVFAEDKYGNTSTNTINVKKSNLSPLIISGSSGGIGTDGSFVYNAYKDSITYKLSVTSYNGLKENGISFPNFVLQKYTKANYRVEEPIVESDFISIENGTREDLEYFFWGTLEKGTELIARAEDVNGNVDFTTIGFYSLKKDISGPACEFTALDESTTITSDGYSRRMDDNGVMYAKCEVRTTGEDKPSFYVTLSDTGSAIMCDDGTETTCENGGGILINLDGLGPVTACENSSYTSTPEDKKVTDILRRYTEWKLPIETPNVEYKWNAYDKLGNLTEIRVTWVKD